MPELTDLAETIRNAPGLQAKRELRLVGRALRNIDGDDAALIPHGGEHLVVATEAIDPELVARDPIAAGAAAVVTNVSDVRAMGARPLALVDTVVSPDREHARAVLDGIAWAADLLGVPVVGGHLTIGAHEPAVSAACTGATRTPLQAKNAQPGHVLIAAFSLEGRYRGDAPFFTSLRDRDAGAIRTDGDALTEVAQRGLCHAARDVSMPGVAGSLLQLLELAGCGATLDLDRLPKPHDVPLARWLVTFPSFGFVLAARARNADDALAVFERRGLAAGVCGEFDDSRVLTITANGASAPVWDLAAEPLTTLATPPDA